MQVVIQRTTDLAPTKRQVIGQTSGIYRDGTAGPTPGIPRPEGEINTTANQQQGQVCVVATAKGPLLRLSRTGFL